MKTLWQVNAQVTISIFGYVAAESEEEARELAQDLEMPAVNQSFMDNEWHALPLDGAAREIRATRTAEEPGEFDEYPGT